MATKKVTTETKKAGAVKTTPVKTEAVKAEPVKSSTTEKVTEKKTTVKKAATKKTAAKKDIKVKTVVQCYGKQVEEKDIIANVKKAWTKSGNKVGDIKTMELYIKPEESAVYYVINGTVTGSVEF